MIGSSPFGFAEDDALLSLATLNTLSSGARRGVSFPIAASFEPYYPYFYSRAKTCGKEET
jgi:hypothetical protein